MASTLVIYVAALVADMAVAGMGYLLCVFGQCGWEVRTRNDQIVVVKLTQVVGNQKTYFFPHSQLANFFRQPLTKSSAGVNCLDFFVESSDHTLVVGA